MKYQKPELVPMGPAITAIQAAIGKDDNTMDHGQQFTAAVYRADE
jgi:hypothetical protein